LARKSARPDWTAIYYHRADSVGLGFDRTLKEVMLLGYMQKKFKLSGEIQILVLSPIYCGFTMFLGIKNLVLAKRSGMSSVVAITQVYNLSSGCKNNGILFSLLSTHKYLLMYLVD
jgi:hypothetical protein